MAEYREAKAEKRSYKKLAETHLKPVKGEHGGHLVSHHYQSDGMSMPKVEEHMFGKDGYAADGTHIFEHLAAKHKIPMPEAHAEQHAGPETVEQAASEPASEDVNA